MKLGEFIKNYRINTGMSMRNFAAASGLSAGYISMLENNRNPKTGEPITPSISTYQAVAKATGRSINDLIAAVSDDIDIPELNKTVAKRGRSHMKAIIWLRSMFGGIFMDSDSSVPNTPGKVPISEEALTDMLEYLCAVAAGLETYAKQHNIPTKEEA